MVELSRIQPARKAWPNDVWPDDRRLVDLHRAARESCRELSKLSPQRASDILADRSRANCSSPAALAGWAARNRSPRPWPARVCLGIEVDPARIEKRLQSGYCDKIAHSLDEALQLLDDARTKGEAISVGLVGNCADVLPEMVRRGVVPDVLTDQTSAHDALNGYVPNGMTLAEALALARENPGRIRCSDRWPRWRSTSKRCSRCKKKGAITFDYGNNIRTQAKKAGCEKAFDIPGFVPEYIRPLFCEGKGPFRWVALSGDPDGHRADRSAGARAFSGEQNSRALDEAGAGANSISGFAGAHLLARLRRAGGIRSGDERTR